MLFKESFKEAVRLHIENTAVIYLAKSVCDSVPSDFSSTWKRVQIGYVIDVVSVDTSESVVSYNTYSILRLSARERNESIAKIPTASQTACLLIK